MVFSSAVFLLIFLPVTLAVYYLAPQKARNLILFIVSLIFYAWGEPIYILIMLFSTVFDYCNGLAIERFEAKGNTKGKKGILILSLMVNLGLLCFFKYTDFLIGTVNNIPSLNMPTLGISLPIGISFYTFQTLSYTIDVYRGKVKSQHNIISFGMYICMFPQLIAGPIVRYADIESQLDNRTVNPSMATDGIFRFTIGLAKKVLLANQAGLVWDEISSLDGIPTATAWIGALAFMLQIYFDFSGYSDMAIGLAKMLGFELMENFRYPYESKSVSEFWRRWHISLGTWFKEYLYIPLGGNRKGTGRTVFNLLIVWFLTGLWHGAGWNFVLWGLYFFVLLVIEKLFLRKYLEKLPAIAGHIYTLLAVLVSWVIFACDDMSRLGLYIRSLFGFNGFADNTSVYYLSSNIIILLLGAAFSVSAPKKLALSMLKRINNDKLRFAVKVIVAAILLAVSLLFVVGDSYNPFLYFRF